MLHCVAGKIIQRRGWGGYRGGKREGDQRKARNTDEQSGGGKGSFLQVNSEHQGGFPAPSFIHPSFSLPRSPLGCQGEVGDRQSQLLKVMREEVDDSERRDEVIQVTHGKKEIVINMRELKEEVESAERTMSNAEIMQ